MPVPEWTEARIAKLRKLWDDQALSTAELGRQLGVSKNAVVGKAHRLGLPGRPSPITRTYVNGTQVRRTVVHRVKNRPTLAPAAPPAVRPPSAEPRSAPDLCWCGRKARHSGKHIKAKTPTPTAAPRPPPALTPTAPKPYGRIITCCWPMGEPGTRAFRFCDDASDPGKPYCAAHCKTAYNRVRDGREEYLDRHEWHGPDEEERCRICYARRSVVAGLPCAGRPAGIAIDKQRAA